MVNTTAKRRGSAKLLSAQFRKIAALNGVDVIEGDFDTCACRERGKAKLSSVEEAWMTTLLSPPPDLVPMWGQNEDSGDCCGFSGDHEEYYKLVGCQAWKSSVFKEKLHIKVTHQDAHLPLFMHLCEIYTVERSTRSPGNTEGSEEMRGVERKSSDKLVCPEIPNRYAMVAATLGTSVGQGGGLLDLSMAFLVFSLGFRRAACRALSFCLETIRSARCMPAVFQEPPMSKSGSTSHGPWQGSARWKQGWSGARKGWDDSSATVAPAQNPEQISDERVTMALHTMQDRQQQTTVIDPLALYRKCFPNNLRLKAKGDAVYEAMKALTQARRIFEQNCDEASVAETLFIGTTKDTLEEAEALERHVKTVTMRAEWLATTDVDFFKPLLNRQEEALSAAENTLTRHIFSCLHACFTVSHVTLAQDGCLRHVIHVSCACVPDLTSTLHSALFTVSLIFYFILLIFIFTFHVGRFGENSRVRFRE